MTDARPAATEWPCRWADAWEPWAFRAPRCDFTGRSAFEFEVARFVSEWKPGGKIAIRAGGPHRQCIHAGLHGVQRQIHQRQVDFGTLVVNAVRRPPVRRSTVLAVSASWSNGETSRTARSGRCPFRWSCRLSTSSTEKISVASVRRTSGTTRYSYFCSFSRMGSAVCGNRFTTGEQSRPEAPCGDSRSPGVAAVRSPSNCENRNITSTLLLNPADAICSSPVRSMKKNFSGKREILLHQPVADERARGHREACPRRPRTPPAAAPTPAESAAQHGFRRQVANHDTGQVRAQQFVQSIH